jgi:ergothioneine biosynthesis protein EgtB
MPATLSECRLLERYRAVRGFTGSLTEPLTAEDCALQSMPDASPTRWHLAHTTWFFETFVLARSGDGHRHFHPDFAYLFNSYYQSVGRQFPRPCRGLLSRPGLAEVRRYRAHVDSLMEDLLEGGALPADLLEVVELGLEHEQQHQELILTDLKHLLSLNPLHPVYRERPAGQPARGPDAVPPLSWLPHAEAVRPVGHHGPGFAFDNESPRHRVFLERFELASRLATSGEYLEFMADGGYRRPELWLSAGFDLATEEGWRAPLYWLERDGEWWQFTLSGLRRVDPAEPVAHLSYFEADAFARWSGGRLPTEFEWEAAAENALPGRNFAEDGLHHPVPADPGAPQGRPAQMLGDLWEWTSSSYGPYPGYRPLPGALGEYNGKFMCNQYVLKGGSCATPRAQIRTTYRNFFPPQARWQFTGVRLARS